jgi:hypothetical protein
VSRVATSYGALKKTGDEVVKLYMKFSYNLLSKYEEFVRGFLVS